MREREKAGEADGRQLGDRHWDCDAKEAGAVGRGRGGRTRRIPAVEKGCNGEIERDASCGTARKG